MDLISIAMGLAQFAPILTKWITGSDKDAEVAQKAIDIAKAITGQPTGDQALDALKASPDLVLQFRKAVMDQEIAFQTLAVQNAADINKTMQSEASADHWPTYSWRPAIGFAFAMNLVLSSLIVIGTYTTLIFGVQNADKAVQALPQILTALAAINALATPILGVAAWFRGKMQADPSLPTDNRG